MPSKAAGDNGDIGPSGASEAAAASRAGMTDPAIPMNSAIESVAMPIPRRLRCIPSLLMRARTPSSIVARFGGKGLSASRAKMPSRSFIMFTLPHLP